MLGTSLAVTVVSCGGCGSRGVGLVAFLILGVIGVCVLAGLFMLAYVWPDDTGVIREPKKAKPVPARCKKCGYDLRASPEYCPECGTPRVKEAVRVVRDRGPGERPGVAYIVYFRTRTESADLRIAVEQMQVIATLKGLCPEAAELVLAPADRKRPTVVAAETVAAAAEELLGAIKSNQGVPTLQTALRRVRQFARKHACKRLEREVGWMMATPGAAGGGRG